MVKFAWLSFSAHLSLGSVSMMGGISVSAAGASCRRGALNEDTEGLVDSGGVG